MRVRSKQINDHPATLGSVQTRHQTNRANALSRDWMVDDISLLPHRIALP